MNILGRELSADEIAALEKVARSQKTQVRYARRASYILAANRNRHVCDAIREGETDRRTLYSWCRRYLKEGLAGLLDLPRSGSPGRYTPEQRGLLIKTALTSPLELGLPFGEWTQQRLADYLHTRGVGIGPSRVGEILREEGLRWHTQESWYGKAEVVSPDFAEKRGPSSGHTRRLRKVV